MPGRSATFQRGLRRAAGALLLLGLCVAPALAAMPGGAMAKDALESLTRPPSSRQDSAPTDFSKTGAHKTGAPGPTAPKAPVVPGASTAPETPLRLDQRFDQRLAPTSGQGGQGTRTPSSSTQGSQQPRQPARQQVLTLTHDGAERRALITLPGQAFQSKGQAAQPKGQAKAQAAPKLPVIIFLHGAGGSAMQAMRQTNLAGRAAAAGFMAVFPDGLGPEDGQTWNAWTCCGFARDSRANDVGFLSVLVGRLRAEFNADPARIHLAGFSNGAMLASRFALERPGVAATLSAIAGSVPCDAPAPQEPLPVLIIHGDQDQVARYNPTPSRPATGRLCEDHLARAQADFWVRGLGLAPTPHLRETPSVRVEDYAPQRQGGRGQLRFVIVKGGGHSWPGGTRERYRYCDAPSAGLDATGLLLDFCKRQGKAAPPAQKQPAKNR
ncbi:CE1 family esterase [Humidesulfovibrio sp.]